MADPNEVWREPVRGQPGDISILGLPGLERMQASVRGQLPAPPIHYFSGIRPVDAGPGTSTFLMPASPWWRTPADIFIPGVMAFAADAALGGAIIASVPAGRALATSDLTMSYLRPASTASERLVARAHVVHAGRSLGLSQVIVEDGHGRLLGHGTSRCFLFDPVSPPPDPPRLEGPWPAPHHETPDPYLRPAPGEVIPQEVWDRMSGLEVFRALMDERLPAPPVYYFMGGRWIEADEGRATFVQPAIPWFQSPAGTVYGGAIAYIADLCLLGAVQTTVPAKTAFSPLDLKVNFIRPVFPDGRNITAVGEVVHRGKTLAVANAELKNEEGKVVAVATGSTLILPDRPWMVKRPVVAEEEAKAAGEEA